MRRLALTTAVAVGLFALACTDERQEGPTGPSLAPTAKSPCPSTDPIQSQICALFKPTDNLKSASDFYSNLQTKVRQGREREAQARAVDLVNFTFKQYYAGKLLDPSGSTTEEGVVQLTCDVLDYVESGWTDCEADLGPGLTSTSSSPHSTIQVCGPAGCLVRPEDKHSGVSVPPDACPTLCIISVDPIPPNHGSPRDGPLSHLTDLDQYPLFRELKLFASFDEFDEEVIVGICHLSPDDGGPFAPPDAATEARLRLAHPDPDNSEQIEILDKVAATFLDCSDLFADNDEFTPPPDPDIEGSVGSLQLRGFASAAQSIVTRALGPVLQTLFLPEPAEAAVLGSCCLGGATTKFSPWAAVDPESGSELSFAFHTDLDEAFDPGGKELYVGSRDVLRWWYTGIFDGAPVGRWAYPAVEVLDANGDPQPDITVSVSLIPVSGSLGTLGGTPTASTSEFTGFLTAFFDDLTIDLPGVYRLEFTAPGVEPVQSGEFTVGLGPVSIPDNFGSADWSYKQISSFDPVPQSWWTITPTPVTGWTVGTAPFGTSGSCELPEPVTPWSQATTMLLRRDFLINQDVTSITLEIRVDGDVFASVNGWSVDGGGVFGVTCGSPSVQFTIPASQTGVATAEAPLLPGQVNKIFIRGVDDEIADGSQSHLDARITVNTPPPIN